MAQVKKIEKKDWLANFTLVGRPKISADYTYKVDQKSQNSNWIYNSLNLGIDCGEKHGVVYAEMMGGYSEEKKNVIYAHGKKEDGSDDFETQILVDWDDRSNDEVLETIGDMSFITVGIEKTNDGKTFYKKFLSEYDAIAYIQKHLTEDMVVNVRGVLKYSTYKGNTQIRKVINSIALSKVEEPSKFYAHFTQSILIDRDSANLKNVDKDKGVLYINAKVLDYVKEMNGVEIKGQYPFDKQFEFELDLTNQTQCNAIMEKVFKVKKGITQITFEGDLIEGGAVVTATLDDVPKDIKDLIAIGVYSEEEALAKCTVNGGKERRMVLRKPLIRLVGDEKVPVVQKFEERYEEDDLYIDLGEEAEEPPFDVKDETVTESVDSMDWLNQL